MNAGWPWDVLDMRPSGDVRAIRRAYAAALKAGSYDSDAEAFMALRNARDAAIELAEAGEVDDFDVGLGASGDQNPAVIGPRQDIVETDAFAITEEAIAKVDGRAAPATQTNQSEPGHPDLDDRPIEDLYKLLFDTLVDELSGTWPRPRRPSVPDQLEAILRDPRLADIAEHDNADHHIAEILARTIPASDAVIPRASQFFGWAGRADQLDAHPAIRFIIERQSTLQFWHAVQQPGHRLNRAWRLMVRPPHASEWPAWVAKKRVDELMQTIRQHYPALESELSGERVGNWEFVGNASKPAYNQLMFLGFLALLLFSSLVSLIDGKSASSSDSSALTATDADIDKALKTVLNDALPVASLREKNEAAYSELVNLWWTAKAAGSSLATFTTDVDYFVADRTVRAFSKISYATLAEQWQIRRDAVVAGAPRLPTRCAITLPITALLKVKLPDEIARRVRKNIAATITEAKDPLPSLQEYYAYSIPEQLIKQTAQRVEMSATQVRAVLRDPEESETKCRIRMALVEATLAAPRSLGFEVLRGM